MTREVVDLQPRMIDLDPRRTTVPEALLHEILFPDSENHIAYREGNRYVARLVRNTDGTARLTLPEEPGWKIAPHPDRAQKQMQTEPHPTLPLRSGEVRVEVEAAGLNFTDVLQTIGVLEYRSLGREMCGRIIETSPDIVDLRIGDRVAGLGFDMLAPQVVTRADLVTAAPVGMSAAALATVPLSFVTAALAFDMAELAAGERVLIHAATGGVGLAAIQLAIAAGAEVLATASTPKQAFLRSMGIRHVFDSRQTEFGQQILEATGGEGVQVVLNSLTGPGFIQASLSCLGESGRFVEIGRHNIWSEDAMSQARPDVSYSILAVDVLKEEDPARVGGALRRVMESISDGRLTPLIHTRWPLAETGAAIDFMRSARHIGKIVLTISPFSNKQLRGDRTYLVTGGLGGIGCALAGWLADRGAGAIVLNGRADPTLPFSFLPTLYLSDILTVDYDFLPEATHLLQLEQPQACASALREFLETIGEN